LFGLMRMLLGRRRYRRRWSATVAAAMAAADTATAAAGRQHQGQRRKGDMSPLPQPGARAAKDRTAI
jgi:hypothetical protein